MGGLGRSGLSRTAGRSRRAMASEPPRLPPPAGPGRAACARPCGRREHLSPRLLGPPFWQRAPPRGFRLRSPGGVPGRGGREPGGVSSFLSEGSYECAEAFPSLRSSASPRSRRSRPLGHDALRGDLGERALVPRWPDASFEHVLPRGHLVEVLRRALQRNRSRRTSCRRRSESRSTTGTGAGSGTSISGSSSSPGRTRFGFGRDRRTETPTAASACPYGSGTPSAAFSAGRTNRESPGIHSNVQIRLALEGSACREKRP